MISSSRVRRNNVLYSAFPSASLACSILGNFNGHSLISVQVNEWFEGLRAGEKAGWSNHWWLACPGSTHPGNHLEKVAILIPTLYIWKTLWQSYISWAEKPTYNLTFLSEGFFWSQECTGQKRKTSEDLANKGKDRLQETWVRKWGRSL